MKPRSYRIRLLSDLLQVIGVPVCLLSVFVSIFRYRLGPLSIPIHLAFILLLATLKGVYSETRQDSEALSLGARPIPRVVGKWPGNVDILLRMMGAFKTSYVLDVYLQLFEEYQSTTLNLRILWRDNVCGLFVCLSSAWGQMAVPGDKNSQCDAL